MKKPEYPPGRGTWVLPVNRPMLRNDGELGQVYVRRVSGDCAQSFDGDEVVIVDIGDAAGGAFGVHDDLHFEGD